MTKSGTKTNETFMAKANSNSNTGATLAALSTTTPETPAVQTSGPESADNTPASAPDAPKPAAGEAMSEPDKTGKTYKLTELKTMSAEKLIEIGLTNEGKPLREIEDPLRPGQQRQQRPDGQTKPEEPKAAAKPTVEAEAQKAKERLAKTLNEVRAAAVRDQNVIGGLENAFEDTKNALQGNRASVETLEAAAKALQIGANALANHSGTAPGALDAARQAALATKHAAENLK